MRSSSLQFSDLGQTQKTKKKKKKKSLLKKTDDIKMDHVTFEVWNDVRTKMCYDTYLLLLCQWNHEIRDEVSRLMKSTTNPNYFVCKFQFQCTLFVSMVLKKNLPVKLKNIDMSKLIADNFFDVDLKEHNKWGLTLIRDFRQNQNKFDQWWDEKTHKMNKNMNPLLVKLVKLCLEHVTYLKDGSRGVQSTKKHVCLCLMF